jgi:predicted HNH restriction endonuclease
LYISSKAGFKPKGGEIWFIFLKEGDIWIGAMPEHLWRSVSSELKEDEYDELYQSSVNDTTNTDKVRIAKLKERDAYARDRNIAIKRMTLSGFICEYNPSHKLFVSRFSKKPYLEAHHLVPIGLQKDFEKPLDTIHNVFCLCPYCHRAVHHAEVPVARNILSNLAAKRPILKAFNLSVPDLLSFYAVEVID